MDERISTGPISELFPHPCSRQYRKALVCFAKTQNPRFGRSVADDGRACRSRRAAALRVRSAAGRDNLERCVDSGSAGVERGNDVMLAGRARTMADAFPFFSLLARSQRCRVLLLSGLHNLRRWIVPSSFASLLLITSAASVSRSAGPQRPGVRSPRKAGHFFLSAFFAQRHY